MTAQNPSFGHLLDLLRQAKPHLFAVDRKAWCWCDITVPGTPHDPYCKWVADVEEVGALRVEIDRIIAEADRD